MLALAVGTVGSDGSGASFAVVVDRSVALVRAR
jgi:hypothetical protein